MEATGFAARAKREFRLQYAQGLLDFAGGSDGVDEPVAGIVGTDEELTENVAALVFGELELVS